MCSLPTIVASRGLATHETKAGTQVSAGPQVSGAESGYTLDGSSQQLKTVSVGGADTASFAFNGKWLPEHGKIDSRSSSRDYAHQKGGAPQRVTERNCGKCRDA
jgi:hypothetical protein